MTYHAFTTITQLKVMFLIKHFSQTFQIFLKKYCNTNYPCFFSREMFNSTSDISSNMIGERIQQVAQMSDEDILVDIKMGKAAFFGNVHLLSAMKARADDTAQGKYSTQNNITVPTLCECSNAVTASSNNYRSVTND